MRKIVVLSALTAIALSIAAPGFAATALPTTKTTAPAVHHVTKASVSADASKSVTHHRHRHHHHKAAAPAPTGTTTESTTK